MLVSNGSKCSSQCIRKTVSGTFSSCQHWQISPVAVEQRKCDTSCFSISTGAVSSGVCSTSLRSGLVCIYGAICLQIQKYFSPDPAIFSQRSNILLLLYVVSKLKQIKFKISGQNSKIQYYVFKIKFVDISHHRCKLRRDIE
jgi:hypothetical protein